MRIIGLHGKKQAGKDTIYRIIGDYCYQEGINVQRVGFADKLKLSALRALGYDGNGYLDVADQLKQPGATVTVTYDDPLGFPRGMRISGREYLQRYGTEAHREVFGTDFWVDAVLPPVGPDDKTGAVGARLAEMYPGVDILVLTDVRFPNEATRIKALGGEIWQIERPRVNAENDEHASEQPLSGYLIDRIIANDSNLSVLANRVIEALTS